MKTAFWIIVAVSTGSYNGGNISQLDIRLESEAACLAVAEQIEPTWGIATVNCVLVEGGIL